MFLVVRISMSSIDKYTFCLFKDQSREEEWLTLAKDAGITYEERVCAELKSSISKLQNNEFDWLLGIPYALSDSTGGRIVGTAVLKQTDYDGHNVLSLWHIAIAEDLRGQGLGTVFMNHLFQAIRDHGKNCTTLFTRENPAFYKSCGMTEYGRISGKLLGGGEDRVFFIKEL